MRLTTDQQRQIQGIVAAHIGDDAVVSVYGSRTNDEQRGGDVDLFIEASYRVSLMERAALKLSLETELSLPVDIVVHAAGEPVRTFQAIAKARSQPIEGTATDA